MLVGASVEIVTQVNCIAINVQFTNGEKRTESTKGSASSKCNRKVDCIVVFVYATEDLVCCCFKDAKVQIGKSIMRKWGTRIYTFPS